MYAAGNIGDLIKHSWLIEISRSILYRLRGEKFVFVDAFAGLPVWEITPQKGWAVWRGKVGTSPLARLQRPFEKGGNYAGSSTLVGLVCEEASVSGDILVYDLEEERRAPLQKAGFRLIDGITSGYDVLSKSTLLETTDLLLLDPCEFLPRSIWTKHLDRLVEAACKVPVLLFLYNKVPFRKNYDDFRKALADKISSKVAGCLGGFREGSAWYEVVLLLSGSHHLKMLLPKILDGVTRQIGEATVGIDKEAFKFEGLG